jgi:hypothetical protein
MAAMAGVFVVGTVRPTTPTLPSRRKKARNGIILPLDALDADDLFDHDEPAPDGFSLSLPHAVNATRRATVTTARSARERDGIRTRY